MNNHELKTIKISKQSSIPLYIQLREIIKEQIAQGNLKPDSLLPSERKLCEICNISHITVRQALVELTKEGFLFRVPGKGTFVKGKNQASEAHVLSFGVVIPETEGKSSPLFVSDLLLGIKSVTTQYNHPLLLYTETESRYLLDTSEGTLQGLILTNPQIREMRIPMIKKNSVPLVVIGKVNEKDVYTVDNDNVWIGYTLTSHLLESGHKKICFINGPAYLTVSQDKLKGYEKALEEYNISLDEFPARYGDFSEENGYQNAKDLIAKGVTAIVCFDDLVALGTLRAVNKKGLKVPQDIGLTGCNNSPFAEHSHPPLTTIDIFPYKIGQKAAEKLIKIIHGEDTEERTIIKGKLIARESTIERR